MITQDYSGNRDLKLRWCDYIGNFCLQLRNSKLNISGYRNINETLGLINQKLKPQFFPVANLGPYDDTLDSYFIHFLTFGWFNYETCLSSVLGITFDPYDVIVARVQQYQAFLAYEQNPAQNNTHERTPVLHVPKPGILYVVDEKENQVKCLILQQAEIQEQDGLMTVKYHVTEENIELMSNPFKFVLKSVVANL